jgi:hypothetical protein
VRFLLLSIFLVAALAMGLTMCSRQPHAVEGVLHDRVDQSDSGALLSDPGFFTPGRIQEEVGEESNSASSPEGPLRDKASRQVPWGIAKEYLRSIVIDVDSADKSYFERFAMKWPSGVDVLRGVPDLTSSRLNPLGKTLGPVDLKEIEGILGDYDSLLGEMANDAIEMYGESLVQYFESSRYECFASGQALPPRAKRTQTGHFNRRLTVEYSGWIIRVDYDSIDWPLFDGLLGDIAGLRRERLQAVEAFIAGL